LDKEIKVKLVSAIVAFILVAIAMPISTAGESSGVWSWSNPIYIEIGDEGIEIDSPYNGTYENRHKVQLHAHTTDSDGSFRPSELMRFHENEDYLALSITDHDCEKYEASLEDPGGHDIIHIPGVEYTTGYHMLGIGIDSIAFDGEDRRQEQIDRAYEEDGLTFWAHPQTVEPIPYSTYENYDNWDGIEIFTSNAYSLAEDHADYILTETDHKPLLIASSDTHQRVQEGGWIELVSEKSEDEMNYADVLDGLKKGEFFAVGGWPRVHTSPAEMDIEVENETIHVRTDKEADIQFITNQKNHYLEGEDHVSVERDTTSASYTVDENDTYVRVKATVQQSFSNILFMSMPILILVPTVFMMLVPKRIENKIFVLSRRLEKIKR